MFEKSTIPMALLHLSCIRLYKFLKRFLKTVLTNPSAKKSATAQGHQTYLHTPESPSEYINDRCSSSQKFTRRVLCPEHVLLYMEGKRLAPKFRCSCLLPYLTESDEVSNYFCFSAAGMFYKRPHDFGSPLVNGNPFKTIPFFRNVSFPLSYLYAGFLNSGTLLIDRYFLGIMKMHWFHI